METDSVAQRLFGDREPLARRLAQVLATTAVERGLVGPREADRIWERHVLNCAVLCELVEPGARLVDVGSGAGLPGLVVAIARPDLSVVLVEPLLRRSTFLTEVVAELELDVDVVRGRAEEPGVRSTAGGADVVTARAVAPLAKLMTWCLPLARVGGRVLAMKGASAAEELERDRAAVARAGGGALRVRECGADVLGTPTLVVEAVRQAGRVRASRASAVGG